MIAGEEESELYTDTDTTAPTIQFLLLLTAAIAVMEFVNNKVLEILHASSYLMLLLLFLQCLFCRFGFPIKEKKWEWEWMELKIGIATWMVRRKVVLRWRWLYSGGEK